MVDTAAQNQTPSMVFPLPGWHGPINNHWGDPNGIGGSDLMAPVGQPIVSMVSGKVVFTSTQANASTSGGNSVEIQTPSGLDYYYAHMLNAVNLKVGDSVLAGQPLGVVDNTGDAANTASHLHIGIGYGIQEGVGAAGGTGKNYNAVASLQALVNDPRANNPQFADPNAAPNPPQIQFDPSVPGFTSGNVDGILLNIQEALASNIDPFLWLGIVSKESSFNPNAVNPTSGACGYAQIYPCIPNLSAKDNIDEGIKRLKAFLSQCNGNVNCALNLYSGGGGPLYASDVQSRASSIKNANPGLASGGFSIPTVGGVVGTPGASQNLAPAGLGNCGKINLGSIGPAQIQFDDPLCIIKTALSNMTNQLGNWWSGWQTHHIPDWAFVVLGIIFVVIGGFALANSSGMQMPDISLPESSGEVAPSAEAIAAL
jgi:murein DD-endopeptidase MepM/ murein hydrolase activator NlpD